VAVGDLALLPRIIGDIGPANSGGASVTQRVRISRADGSEYDAHAKFTVDTTGSGIVESSPWGAVAELLASGVARAIGAPASDYTVVLLSVGVDIRLRGDRRPAPGLAIAAPTIQGAVDAIDGMAEDIPPMDLARIAMFHALTQVGDHSGAANHIRAGDPPRIYSVDHASGFPAEHGGGVGPATLSPSSLFATKLAGTPESLRRASAELGDELTDVRINDIIAAVPRQFLPTDEARTRLREALQQRRDALPGLVATMYPK